MIRTRTGRLLVTFTLFCLSAAGCAGEQALTKLGDGLDQQFKDKTDKIESSLKKISDAFAETSKRSDERFKKLQDLLAAKYEEHHKTKKLVFFTEDTEAKAAAAVGPEAGPAAELAARPQEIKSDFLSEQTLERRGLHLLWKLALDGSPVRYADLDDGRLYIVTKKDTMFCIDLKTGLTQWIYGLKRRPDGAPGFNSLYVVISAGDTICVIDKATGTDKWRFETDVQPSSRPYCDEQGFAFGCWDGDVCGFSFGDLYPRWRLKTDDRVFSSPVVRGGFAYVVSDKGSFIKYNNVIRMRSGEVDLGGRPVGDLVSTKDLILIGSENFEMAAFKVLDGQKAWSHSADGRAAGGPWLSPNDETVYYSAIGDGLYALVAITGKERWKLADGVRPIAAFGNDLYVFKSDGAVCKVNDNTGKALWSESAAPFVTAVTQVQSEIICLISQDGQLFALRPKQ
ncbi:MAG: PQQ-binding-like beta-propeller repeat protein [Planctomycetota bacterium]